MHDAPETAKALKALKPHLKGGNVGHKTYFNFYAAQAMHQVGGEEWRSYYPYLRGKVLEAQQSNGAWNGDHVGQVYGTALNLLILEIPYKYLPIFQR